MKKAVLVLLLFVCFIGFVEASPYYYKSLISIGVGPGLETVISDDTGGNISNITIGMYICNQFKENSKTCLFADMQCEIPMKLSSGNYKITRSDLDPNIWMNAGIIMGPAWKKSYSNAPLESIIGIGIAVKEDLLAVSTTYGSVGSMELSFGLGLSVAFNYTISDYLSVLLNLSQQYGLLNWAYNGDSFELTEGFRLSTTARIGFGLTLMP